jgi:LPXTG-motif cell wall-anchored protein
VTSHPPTTVPPPPGSKPPTLPPPPGGGAGGGTGGGNAVAHPGKSGLAKTGAATMVLAPAGVAFLLGGVVLYRRSRPKTES